MVESNTKPISPKQTNSADDLSKHAQNQNAPNILSMSGRKVRVPRMSAKKLGPSKKFSSRMELFKSSKNLLSEFHMPVQRTQIDPEKQGPSNQKEGADKSKQDQIPFKIEHGNQFHELYQMDEQLPVLGEGRHALVRICARKQDQKKFAVKLIRSDDINVIYNTRKEYQIIMHLKGHSGIVQPEGYYEDLERGRVYFVMELASGQSILSKIMQESKSIQQKVDDSYQNDCNQQSKQVIQPHPQEKDPNQSNTKCLTESTVESSNTSPCSPHSQITKEEASTLKALDNLSISASKGAPYFDEEEAKSIIDQLLKIFQYMHEKGVVHRDLNPTNVFIAKKSELSSNEGSQSSAPIVYSFSPLCSYEVKVLDFNVSKLVEESNTENEDTSSFEKKDKYKMITKVGTPIYTAPEMHNFGGVYTEGVDVWGIGIIMYLLLTGTLPFLEYNIPKLRQRLQKGDFDRTSARWKELSFESKDLIEKLLCVQQNERISINDALEHDWLLI